MVSVLQVSRNPHRHSCSSAPAHMDQLSSEALPIRCPSNLEVMVAPRQCYHRPHPRSRAPEWWCASCASINEAGNIASSKHCRCLQADRMLQTRPLRGSGAPWGALCPILRDSFCIVSTGTCSHYSAGLPPRFRPLGLAAVYWTSLRAALL